MVSARSKIALVLTTKQEAQGRQSHSPQRDTGTDPEATYTRRTMGNSYQIRGKVSL